MFRFTYITDIHLRGTTPRSRTDDYTETLFRKLKFVLEYAKKKKSNIILFGGDLIDTPAVSDAIINRFLDIIVEYGIPWYAIYGNHDIKIPKNVSKIGLIEHCELWNTLENNFLVEGENTIIAGESYSKEKECLQSYQIGDVFGDCSSALKIAVLHTMVGNETMIIRGVDKIIAKEAFEVYPHCDMVLTGHYHPGYGIYQFDGLAGTTVYVNPGSMMRLSVTDANQTVGPGLVQGTVKNGSVTLKMVLIPCEDVFDTANEVKAITDEELKHDFVKVLREFRDIVTQKEDLVDKIDVLMENSEMGQKTKERVLKKIKAKIKNARQVTA